MSQLTVTFAYSVQLSVGVWTDITTDVIMSQATVWNYGVQGSGPLDCVASSGDFSFQMRNDARPGKPQGWYSPANAVCRTGWTFGIPFKLVATYNGTPYTRFYGKIRRILPDSGMYGRQQVAVTVYDVMRDLATTDVRAVGIQVNKTEAELVTTVLASLPASAQPLATDIDTGVDTYPYALDDLQGGMNALSVIADVTRSALSFTAVKGDGTFIMRSRYTRAVAANLFTFNNDVELVDVPADLDSVFNVVRVTIRPKTIGGSASVLFSLSGPVPEILSGETFTMWGAYFDPADPQAQTAIGGIVTPSTDPLTPGTDFAGNAAADGSGANLTANLDASATVAFGTTCMFSITNTGAQTVYLTAAGSGGVPLLQVRGLSVTDQSPQTFQSSSTQPYGTSPFKMTMPYQDDGVIAKSAAIYIDSQFSDLTQQLRGIKFTANSDSNKMLAAMTCEPGDRITVSEPVTGMVIVAGFVQRLSFSSIESVLSCQFNLAPASTSAFWQIGVAGASELGVTTVLGF